MIVFEKVSYRNFLSAGNVPIEVQLNAQHMTLINGINGAGKSTILEAIVYGLFGVSYRNINKPQLINSINQKQLEVTIEFKSNNKHYKIVRGMRPNIFEIHENDQLINQDPNIKDYQKVLEQQILKMNYRAFTQVVVMGSSNYVPFMKLQTNARREFIEDLLDIRVFSIMLRQLKDKLKILNDDLKTAVMEMKSLKDKIGLQDAFVKKQMRERAESVEEIEVEIMSLRDSDNGVNQQIVVINDEIAKLQEQANKFENVDEELFELQRAKKNLLDSLKSIQTKSSFYAHIQECPTCKQNVDETHKSVIMKEQKAQEDEMLVKIEELSAELSEIEKKYEEWTAIELKIGEKNQAIQGLLRKISVSQELITQKQKQIEKLTKDTDSIDEERVKLKMLAKEAVQTSELRNRLNVTKNYYDIALVLLQDSGIKSKIIKQYIPVINKLINKYLTDLDFFANFNLDESFNEVVKSRYRDIFTYDSFSEGQKMRIDLALMFAWRDVARLKNSVSCSLLFMDEMGDSSLDAEGRDLMLQLLRQQNNTNVFLISHSLSPDKFDRTLSIGMKNNFSYIME